MRLRRPLHVRGGVVIRRRRPAVNPTAARDYMRATLTRLATLRDANEVDIHQAATAAHDDYGMTYAEIADALRLRSPGAAWHVANDEPTGTGSIDLTPIDDDEMRAV